MSNDTASLVSPAPGLPSWQDLPARLWVVLGGLRQVIAAWGGRDRAAVPLVVRVYGRVGRIAQRFAALVAHLLAGTLPPPRVRAPGRSAPRADYVRLPRGSAWLVRLLQESVGFGCQLQALLAEPAMASLLESCPLAARILRPLRRMLGLDAPAPKSRAVRPVAWWQTVPAAPAAPEVTPCGQVLFPTGRLPWSSG